MKNIHVPKRNTKIEWIQAVHFNPFSEGGPEGGET